MPRRITSTGGKQIVESGKNPAQLIRDRLQSSFNDAQVYVSKLKPSTPRRV